ncbi:MAG: 5-formyltetrahydrofolate cyclo-ligase [Pseudomonadales bacterium]
MNAADPRDFDDKAQARQWAWDALQQQGAARFPFPPHGRIPNFAGAAAAAHRLFDEAPWRNATAIKVNPDAPQRYVREEALARGIRVYVPTPKLQGGFHLLDPDRIPAERFGAAATLASMADWSREVALEDLPALDAIVTGCAAVTLTGKRAGKGAGYSDLEFAILRELGFDAVPVATTVHDLQIVGDFPIEANDIPLTLVCTPTRSVRVEQPLPAPGGIDWSRLAAEDLEAMPLLLALRRLQERRQRRPEVRPQGDAGRR